MVLPKYIGNEEISVKKLFAAILSLMLCVLPLSALAAKTPYAAGDIEIMDTPEGVYHYVLLGLDKQLNAGQTIPQTDVTMIVTLDTKNDRILLTSLMRDTLIVRPNGRKGRINGVARDYGTFNKQTGEYNLDAYMQTLSEHFGIKVDKWVSVDFDQVINVVDILGGVEVTATKAEAQYFKDRGFDKIVIQEIPSAGTFIVSGFTALQYMRIRKISGGEFQRTQRQRTVLRTILKNAKDMTSDEAMNLVDKIAPNLSTNMTVIELYEAAMRLYGMRTSLVQEMRIPIDGTWKNATYANMAILEVDFKKNAKALQAYIKDPSIVPDDPSIAYKEINFD